MKCKKCNSWMEYNFGSWDCECGNYESIMDSNKPNSFLYSDEQDFYVTKISDLHLN